MNEKEKELIQDIYATTSSQVGHTFSETELIRKLDAVNGVGTTAKQLRDLNKTISQLFSQSDLFEDAGRGRWKRVTQEFMRNIESSVADQGGNKKRKGGNNLHGRGASVSARGRGAFTPARGRGGFFGGRGNSHAPSSTSSHGTSFRPQPNLNRPPPPNDSANQRPVNNSVNAPDSARTSTLDGSHDRGNGQNRYSDNRAYNRPQSPRDRYRSQSPRRRSPPRDNYNSDTHGYSNNDGRDYDYGRRDFQNDRPNNYGNDCFNNGNRFNDNHYDGNDYRRRSPSPMRYNDNRYSNNRYNENRNNDYDGYGNRSYNDHGYRRRSPSPQHYRHFSPQRDQNRYSDERGAYSNSRDYNDRRCDNYRPQSPNQSRRGGYSPPRNSHRDDPPPRPDSRSSNRSNYSQFSEGSNPNEETSNVRHEDRVINAPPGIPLSTNRPPGIPITTNGPPGIPFAGPPGLPLAVNGPPGIPVRSENSIRRSDIPSEMLSPDQDESQMRLICKELLDTRTANGSKVHLEQLEDILLRRGIKIPGKVFADRERYIVDLKSQNPGLFRDMYYDMENSVILWKRADVTVDMTEAYASGNKIKDSLDYAIMRRLKSIRQTTFNLSHELTRLVETTHRPLSHIKLRVTNALFNTYKDDYSYLTPEVIINEKQTSSNVPYEFRASLVPKAFWSNKDECHKVTIGRFRKFSNFSVRPSESADEFEKMEKVLQKLMEGKDEKTMKAPEGGWKPNYGCLVEYVDPGVFKKWARGLVVKTELQFTRIYLLDYGVWLMQKVDKIDILPQKYLNIPPYCISCKLNASEEEHFEIDLMEWADTLNDYSDNMFITFKDRDIVSDEGITTFVVDVSVKKLNGDLIDIIDVQYS